MKKNVILPTFLIAKEGAFFDISKRAGSLKCANLG